MNIKHQDFISKYTDPNNSVTYGNGTQAVQAVYHYPSDKTAGVQATRLLKIDSVRSDVERIISELNMGAKVRLNAINCIITGKHRQETTTTTVDAEGKEYKSTTLKAPRASDIVKAVDLVEKITGTYDKNRAVTDAVSVELKAVFRAQRAELTGKRGGGKGAGTS